MTYIEFFDREAAENLGACLAFSPQRVIFVGDSTHRMKEHAQRYRRVLEQRGMDVEFLFRAVPRTNPDGAVRMLQEIVDTYDDCVFDITGGDEMFNFALGMVYEKNPHKALRIHKMNLQTNALYPCDRNGKVTGYVPPTLSVDDVVCIHGGKVIYGGVGENNTYRWDVDRDLWQRVQTLWDICRGNVRFYNAQVAVFEAAEAVGRISEDGLTTVASLDKIEQWLSRRGGKYLLSEGLTGAMCRGGLLTACGESAAELTLSYRDPLAKRLLGKAGTALEMKVFLTAARLCDSRGEPVYNDARSGVVIDWDGVTHDKEQEGIYDTENEVDVVLVHGMIPVFISCKNGIVTSDELYKLDAVARRFGGTYAKRALVATAIPEDTDGGRYLRQRAEDMGIVLVEKIQDMTDSELALQLSRLWR